jgi:hypothetical protein
MTTKREFERRLSMFTSLQRLGISRDDAEELRRISMQLHRWYERECNGEVERDEATGKTYAVYGGNHYAGTCSQRYRTADKERGAEKRLAAIMSWYPDRGAYLQTDPRGASLYIYRHVDLDSRGGRDKIDSCYASIGIAVY